MKELEKRKLCVQAKMKRNTKQVPKHEGRHAGTYEERRRCRERRNTTGPGKVRGKKGNTKKAESESAKDERDGDVHAGSKRQVVENRASCQPPRQKKQRKREYTTEREQERDTTEAWSCLERPKSPVPVQPPVHQLNSPTSSFLPCSCPILHPSIHRIGYSQVQVQKNTHDMKKKRENRITGRHTKKIKITEAAVSWEYVLWENWNQMNEQAGRLRRHRQKEEWGCHCVQERHVQWAEATVTHAGMHMPQLLGGMQMVPVSLSPVRDHCLLFYHLFC